jgi:hypothetical protein
MFSEIHAAESAVVSFMIFSECPIDRDSSVAQLSVDFPDSSGPFVQKDGRFPSNLPIEFRFNCCATTPVKKRSIAIKTNNVYDSLITTPIIK